MKKARIGIEVSRGVIIKRIKGIIKNEKAEFIV